MSPAKTSTNGSSSTNGKADGNANVNTNGTNNSDTVSNDKASSSDNNESGANTSESITSTSSIGKGDNQKLLVQDFMSYLAKEGGIANMTVETKDGRRISAKFEGEIAVPASKDASTSKAAAATAATAAAAADIPPVKDSKATSENAEPEPSKQTAVATATATTTAATATDAKTDSATTTPPTPGLEAFTSKDWSVNYQNKHVEMEVSAVGDTKSSAAGGNASDDSKTSLPPKKRSAGGAVKIEEGGAASSAEAAGPEGQPQWNAMSALVDAATVAQQQRDLIAGSTTVQVAAAAAASGAAFKKKTTKRKPRKIIPEVKEYVDFTQKDILFGRGGRSNHHPGNKAYRTIVTDQQSHYRNCDKNEKTKVAQGIVDYVLTTIGGRFLELDKETQRWFLVPNVVARRKVGQALRENNTEEARAAKRAKYQGKLNSMKGIPEVATKPGDSLSTSGIAPVIAPIAAINDGSNSIVPIAAIPMSIAENNVPAVPMDVIESTDRVEV